jgi:dipeptidyl aminopeptidase/acylaminoacyl peptidase
LQAKKPARKSLRATTMETFRHSMPFIRTAIALATLLSSALCRAAGEPPPPELLRDGLAPPNATVTASLQPYLEGRAARFIDWMSDGSLLIATRFGDTSQIHRVTAPLGVCAQLSFAAGGVLEAAARPLDADSFVYLEQQPSGNTRLYLQRLREHTVQALTEGQYRETQPSWSADGMQLAFLSNRRTSATMDVYLLDMRAPGAAPRLIASADGVHLRIEGWSADARHLLLAQAPLTAGPSAEAQLLIADVGSAQLSPVTLPPPSSRRSHGRAADEDGQTTLQAVDARYAADGHSILVLTRGFDAGGSHQYLHLVLVDPITGHIQAQSAPATEDVEQFAQSADGRYIAYTSDDAGGTSHLRLIDQQRQLEIPIVSVPLGVISSLRFDAEGKRLALTVESPRSPADVYVLEPATGVLTRWTQSETGPVDVTRFVAPRVLGFPTWDSPGGGFRQLSALVYDPDPNAPGNTGPRPVVIWLCSGEGSECRPRYTPLIQYLVRELGYVVIAPNVRGSSGLGAELAAAGEGSLRGDAVRDIGSLLVWISLQPGLDRSRVALFGEGFGAYLALQSLGQYGDRLLGAVAAFPPPLDALDDVPLIHSPVLLVQGLALGETTAPAYEAAQLREGLRSQGVAVQYLEARAAGQFERRSGAMAYHSAVASFLAHLLD